MKFLEVFSGENRSFARECERRGFECDTADIRSFHDYTPTFLGDVREQYIDWDSYAGIWLSPPCETFGKIAQTLKCRLPSLEPLNEKAEDHTRLMYFLMEVLQSLPSSIPWVVENPNGWMKNFMAAFDVFETRTTYCCWNMPFRKPTYFWSNVELPVLPYCVPSSSSCPQPKKIGKGGNRPTLAMTHMIPKDLISRLIDFSYMPRIARK